MTIAENLKEFIAIPAIERRINRDNYTTLIFKVKDGEIVRMEGEYAINAEDIKIEGSE